MPNWRAARALAADIHWCDDEAGHPDLPGSMKGYRLERLRRSFSVSGLVLGTLFFAASLTPTLIPRSFLVQGGLAGLAFGAGYAIGVLGRWLWRYMELPRLDGRLLSRARLVAAIGCALVAVGFLLQTAGWQNSIRALMQLEPVDTAHPLEVALIAAATFLILIGLARLFRLTFTFLSTRINHRAPRRVSNVIAFTVAAILFWSVISGVVFRSALHALDSSFRAYDSLLEPEIAQPVDSMKTGSGASLLDWEELGRAGREFVASGPTSRDIGSFTRKDALEPIRVYVGLRSAETPEEQAKLALEELKRVGGFERAMLILVTPTGSGWVDPAGMNSVEYLHQGNLASVAVQYSYLASWLSLIAEPGYGTNTSRALFKEVYGYWTTLPKDTRPRLYLHGLSLGAMDSQQSTDIVEVFGDPFSGALWSGPPYASRLWSWITANRNPDSPEWLPAFRDGSLVRFMNQHGAPAGPVSDWGAMRIVYLQYASDPISFFDYRDLYRPPEWMSLPRGRDVSPQMRWYPVVTALQLLVDMAIATTAPMGYGHVFAPEHYVDAWIEVTDVRDWPAQEIARLKLHLRGQFK